MHVCVCMVDVKELANWDCTDAGKLGSKQDTVMW
jgi:hypothetical protein